MTVRGFAYVLRRPGEPLVKEERSFSEPPGFALVEVIGCGLCHTDLGYALGQVPTKKAPPIVLGHEVVGRVDGRVVLIPAVLPCGKCAYCASGRGNACPEQQMPGNDVDGGFATHQLARREHLVPVPEGVEPWKFAVVADAVSTAFQAVRRSGLASGDVAAVVGVGGVGGFVAQVAAAQGATVLALDVAAEKLAALPYASLNVRDLAAKAVRAEVRKLARSGLRLRIFECTGTTKGQELAFALLDRGATMVQVGYTPDTVSVRLSNLMAFDATIHGTWGCPVEAYPDVLALIARGAVKLDPFVERAPMSALNDHLAAMAAHKLQKRLVLDPRS